MDTEDAVRQLLFCTFSLWNFCFDITSGLWPVHCGRPHDISQLKDRGSLHYQSSFMRLKQVLLELNSFFNYSSLRWTSIKLEDGWILPSTTDRCTGVKVFAFCFLTCIYLFLQWIIFHIIFHVLKNPGRCWCRVRYLHQRSCWSCLHWIPIAIGWVTAQPQSVF